MPFLLTTAISPGDLEDFNYDRIKIVNFGLKTELKRVTFTIEYGTVQDNMWTTGRFQPAGFPKEYMIHDINNQVDGSGEALPDSTDFTDMMTSLPSDAEELLYDGVSRILYQWLIDNDHFDGTIE